MLVWTIFVTLVIAVQFTLNDHIGIGCMYMTGSDNLYVQLIRAFDQQEFAVMVFLADAADNMGFDLSEYMVSYLNKSTESFFGEGGKFVYGTDSDENGLLYNQMFQENLPSVTIPIANLGLWCVAVSQLDHTIEVRFRNKWGYLTWTEYQLLPIFWVKWVMYTLGLFTMLNAQRFYPKPLMILYEVVKWIVIPAWFGTAVLISELHLRNAFIDLFLVTPWLLDIEWLCQQWFLLWVRYAVWLVCLGWGTLSLTTGIPGVFTAKLITIFQAFFQLIQSPRMYDVQKLLPILLKFDNTYIKGYTFWDALDILDALMLLVAASLMIKAYITTRTKEVTPTVDAGTAVLYNYSVVLVAVPVIKYLNQLLEVIFPYLLKDWYFTITENYSTGKLKLLVVCFLVEEMPIMILLMAVFLLWVRPNRGLLAKSR